MSNPEEDVPELKGGHAPAVKVGGMRIAHTTRPRNESTGKADKDDQEAEAPPPVEERKVMISGAPSHGNKDFPAEAVKAFHEKPLPSKQPPHAPAQNKQIQQPRKM